MQNHPPQKISSHPALEVYKIEVLKTKEPLSEIKGNGFTLQKKRKNIVFFHGYGASAFDLMPLAQELNLDFDVNYFFPNGCCDLPAEFGGGAGRAWFEIPVSHMQKMMMTGQALDLKNLAPEGLKEATVKVLQWLEEMKFDSQTLILGGFSQGAMVALEVALALKEPCHSLLLFSSTLIKENELKLQLNKIKSVRVFQSHGQSDSVLPFHLAKELHQVLIQAQIHAQFTPFPGGHEIPLSVLQKAESFLRFKKIIELFN